MHLGLCPGREMGFGLSGGEKVGDLLSDGQPYPMTRREQRFETARLEQSSEIR